MLHKKPRQLWWWPCFCSKATEILKKSMLPMGGPPCQSRSKDWANLYKFSVPYWCEDRLLLLGWRISCFLLFLLNQTASPKASAGGNCTEDTFFTKEPALEGITTIQLLFSCFKFQRRLVTNWKSISTIDCGHPQLSLFDWCVLDHSKVISHIYRGHTSIKHMIVMHLFLTAKQFFKQNKWSTV